MRTFIAVELPAEVRKNINALVDELKEVGSDVRWVAGENLHITLKFLGEVEDSKVDHLLGLVTRAVAGTGSFQAKFEGLGTFPPGKSPRVVWAGTAQGGEKLKMLADSLEKNLSPAGYRSAEKEFSSHITIGRVKEKKGVDKLIAKMGESKERKFGATEVAAVSIMKSTLTPNGPVYEKIKEVKL